MTELFYCKLLDYISPKEKQNLCSIMQKRKAQIRGYSMLKNVPTLRLARFIAQNEHKFFKTLDEFYSPVYTDYKQAIEDFSPNTAINCFVYFLKNQKIDEEFLFSLMEKKELTVPVESSPPIPSKKTQKKYEEFRQKYLVAYKELEQLKSKLSNFEKDNIELKSLLTQQEQSYMLLQTELDETKQSYVTEVCLLKKHIEYLENILNQKNTEIDNPIKSFIILTEDTFDINGVTPLPFDKVSQLSDMVKTHQKLLFVTNNLPFHIKRIIYKIEGIQDKIQTFSTKADMIEYIEKARKC